MPTETDDFEDNLCPMCLEELDITDRNFKPCQCGYQMCRFCWHHIKENLNGRCPACRSLYDADNYEFTPPDPLELAKIEKQKKDRDKLRKNQEANARKHLSNVRVIQRNLVYVTNLSVNAAREDILKKNDFFGQYGKIVKAVINRNNFYNSNGPQGPSDALTAIQAVDGAVVEGRVLRASFGTTKYCSFFLRNLPCTNPECMYLHELGGDRDSFTKEDMALGKHHIHETLPATVAPPAASKLGPKKPILPPPGTRSSGANKPLAVSSDKIPIVSTSTRGWNVPASTSPPALNPEEWPTTLDAVNYHHQPVVSTSPPPSYVRALSSSAPIAHTKPAPPAPVVSALPATASWGAKSKMENPPPTSPRTVLTTSSSSTPPLSASATSPVPTPIPSPTPVVDAVAAAAAATGISRKNSAPAVAPAPVTKKDAAKKDTTDKSEASDKSDKIVEPRSAQTASEKVDTKAEAKETKTESKAEAKAEAKADSKAESKAAKAEALESKAEPKLDLKAEAKPDTKSETKQETKSKKKIKKEVSFEYPAPSTTPPPSLSSSKPIGPPPGFKLDAAKPTNKIGAVDGNSSSSETESILSRDSGRSSLTSSSETSVWNYGLKRSGDIAPPPGWNPPTTASDPWGKVGTQAKSTDIPEIEQFDPWADNTAIGIVDLILKDNSEDGAANGTAAGKSQLHSSLPHLQTQTPPTFAVPSIPPPDFHWQTPLSSTRSQRSRFDFAQEEDDASASATNGINLPPGFPLVDPGIVAAKPASKSSLGDFDGQTRTTGILPTPNLLAPYSLPPPGLMPIAAPDDWQRSFQALLPNVKISFANMAQNQQAQQAWDNTQDSNANQKPERRLSQPTLPQTQSQAQPNQLSQSQPQIQQQQQTKKGAKQTQMPNQQMQQQQIQIQQHQMQQLHHHQQQQQLQQLQQQLHQQQLLQHQQLQQQLQQQQMHLQQHQLQQLQQRQQQIHQLQLQQQYQQLQADNKSPLPTSPRAGDENSEWFNNHKKENQDRSKKGGLDVSDGSVESMPKGKTNSRPPGFPASSQPQQASPPLAQQPSLLPPPGNIPFRDPAILGAGMAYMVPNSEEHHQWGYRGPPPFPLQPPHHQPPHMPRGMGLVSILTPPPRNPMPAPFGFAPNAANGANATSPPMMFAPNDILVPGAGILGTSPGIASVNTASNDSTSSLSPSPSPPPSNESETPQSKLSKAAAKRLKQQRNQLLLQQQQQQNHFDIETPETPSKQTSGNKNKDKNPPTPSPSAPLNDKPDDMNTPNINNQARDIEIDTSQSPASSSEASNDNESVESYEEKRKSKKKKKAKNKERKEKEQQLKAAEAAKKKTADKESNPKKPQQQSQSQTQSQPCPSQQSQQSQKQLTTAQQPLPLPQYQPLNLQQIQPMTTVTMATTTTMTTTTTTTTTTQLPSFHPIQKLSKKDGEFLLPAANNIANLSIGDVNIKFRNEMTMSGDEIGFTVEVGGVGSSAVVETLEKEVANAKKELREWEEKLQQVKMRNGIF